MRWVTKCSLGRVAAGFRIRPNANLGDFVKFFQSAHDGGEKSGVTGFFLVEIKSLFSVVVLRFKPGSREAFHSHAFNAVTWFVKGKVVEHRIDTVNPGNVTLKEFTPSWKPKFTKRENHHKVYSVGESVAVSFRGPWVDQWREYLPSLKRFVTLTHGRQIVQ